ncbi:MAG: hypothetical protein ACE5J7_00020 [Candidatus Aenigmatarchaeota archaeon]
MESLDSFGYVWMAPSPFTDNLKAIKKAIDAGVDTIVLKSVTSSARAGEPKKGKRIIKKGFTANIDQTLFVPYEVFDESTGETRASKTLFCTSTDLDIEILSFEEANALYDQVKEYSPETKVIQSFKPHRLADFPEAKKLKADAIEFNPRWYETSNPRPCPAVVWKDHDIFTSDDLGLPPEIRKDVQDSLLLREEAIRKAEEFKKGLSSLRLDIPVLYKFVREHWEMGLEEQICFPADGYTYADSRKVGSYQTKDGYCRLQWGKGSLCGEILKEDTRGMIKMLRSRKPETYISASGGIMALEDALYCLENGADSVQLCSAVYFDGFRAVKKIVEGVAKAFK